MLMHKSPLLMGGIMGLMLPWMMHIESGGGAGLLFVFAHIALVAGLAALALFIPAVRRKMSVLMGHLFHLPIMGVGLISGWMVTCAVCLATGGVHWT